MKKEKDFTIAIYAHLIDYLMRIIINNNTPEDQEKMVDMLLDSWLKKSKVLNENLYDNISKQAEKYDQDIVKIFLTPYNILMDEIKKDTVKELKTFFKEYIKKNETLL